MILKINKKKTKDISESINLIPMINLIFLLLIFFLLTGVIQKKDNKEILNPESFFGVKKNQSVKEIYNVISITKNGELLLNDSNIELFELDKQQLGENSKILVNIDKNAKIKELNEIFDFLKRKG
ncbi:MAG: hypothetical protein CMM95_01150, partial [Rickettsiales bacterium]|nr:hypothetical protein [Rickettsiales bacterium]